MNSQIKIRRDLLVRYLKIDLSKVYIWEKRDVSIVFCYLGILLAYLGSLHPWFLWPVGELYIIPAAFFVLIGYMVSNSMSTPILNHSYFFRPIVMYFILSFYILIVGGMNINAYIVNVFSVIFMYVLFRFDRKDLNAIGTFLSKAMACILVPSILAYLMHLFGFSFPGRNAVFGDNQYTYTNYYLFMVDDRLLGSIFQRFSSVFLEPGHLGSATSVLLMTQIGAWKKWWNLVLIFATVLSFSLAAFAILIALVFLGLWVKRKNIVGKLLLTLILFGSLVGGALYYEAGDNIFAQLILSRLELNDKTGDIVGNNRVDVGFEKEFDKFIVSKDALFGRDMNLIPQGTGNSGYRVFIYSNGLVGFLFVVLFYAFSFKGCHDFRQLIMVIFISLLIFWIRGYPLWYSNFIPIFVAAFNVSYRDENTLCS